MIGDHHGWAAGRATLLIRAVGEIFGTHNFTTTTDWDPGTVTTVRLHGNGGVGTTYLNTSTFLGRTTQLTYVVDELVDQQTHSASWGEQDRHRR